MARMNWERGPRRVIPVVQNLQTFCRRCGKSFIPFRRYHRLCSTCVSKSGVQ